MLRLWGWESVQAFDKGCNDLRHCQADDTMNFEGLMRSECTALSSGRVEIGRLV